MLVTEDLIARVERSEAARLRSSASAAGGDVLDVAGGVAAFCGDGSPSTQVAAVGIQCEVSDRELDVIAEHFRGRATQYEFKLSPLSGLSLRERVVRRAKTLPEFETLLVCDLEGLRADWPDVDIRPIDAEDTLAYAERAVRRFHSGHAAPPGLVELIAKACLAGSSRGYEVWMDGKPVAGCGLGFSDGVAWLQGAATEPEYRGRGLHKAMQKYRMLVAQKEGYKLMAQGALPGSASQINAQKSGFEIAFTRPTFYL